MQLLLAGWKFGLSCLCGGRLLGLVRVRLRICRLTGWGRRWPRRPSEAYPRRLIVWWIGFMRVGKCNGLDCAGCGLLGRVPMLPGGWFCGDLGRVGVWPAGGRSGSAGGLTPWPAAEKFADYPGGYQRRGWGSSTPPMRPGGPTGSELGLPGGAAEVRYCARQVGIGVADIRGGSGMGFRGAGRCSKAHANRARKKFGKVWESY